MADRPWTAIGQKGESWVWLLHGHQMKVRGGHVVLRVEHTGREVIYEGLSREVQVLKHLIRAPASEETKDVSVNLGNKECRCTDGPQREG